MELVQIAGMFGRLQLLGKLARAVEFTPKGLVLKPLRENRRCFG